MIPTELRQRFFPSVHACFDEGFFSWMTQYSNRPCQILFGLCPTQPPAEIAKALPDWTFERINHTAVWSSETERAFLVYYDESGYLEYTYHPNHRSFEARQAFLEHYAWD